MSENNEQLAHRFAAVWNEPDANLRAKLAGELWADDAIEFTESSIFRGHGELRPRVAQAYEEFVRKGGSRFRVDGAVNAHHDAVLFTVEMVPADGGDATWHGAIMLITDGQGRILRDYQFALA